MSLANILSQSADLEEAAKATLGIAHAYDESPEELRYWPCSVRYPRTGDLEYSLGLGAKSLHHFIIEVHFERGRPGGLAECEAKARVLIERYRDLYAANLTIGGSCDTSGFDKPSYEYGRLEWAGIETIGIRFNLWAKEMLDGLTVSL